MLFRDACIIRQEIWDIHALFLKSFVTFPFAFCYETFHPETDTAKFNDVVKLELVFVVWEFWLGVTYYLPSVILGFEFFSLPGFEVEIVFISWIEPVHTFMKDQLR